MAFDSAAQTNLRPGERLLAGKPYVFDQDALNAHLADLDVENAPADLSILADDEITGLFYSYLNRRTRKPFDAVTIDLGERVCRERHARPMSAAERGMGS